MLDPIFLFFEVIPLVTAVSDGFLSLPKTFADPGDQPIIQYLFFKAPLPTYLCTWDLALFEKAIKGHDMEL